MCFLISFVYKKIRWVFNFFKMVIKKILFHYIILISHKLSTNSKWILSLFKDLTKIFKSQKKRRKDLSKLETLEDKENDVYKNRIQFFKDHIELKKTNPSYYSDLDINFDSLLSVYLTPSPRDTFYQQVFGMSFAAKRAESIPQSVND